MALSSVDSYINAQPEQAMSFGDWHRQNYSAYFDPNSLVGRISNYFDGIGTREKQEYQTYLDNLDRRNEFNATQSARAYDKLMDDSKVQRMMRDYEKAGLNPYLLVNSSGVSASSIPSSSKANYGASSKMSDKKVDNSGRNIALLLLAVARIAAAFL